MNRVSAPESDPNPSFRAEFVVQRTNRTAEASRQMLRRALGSAREKTRAAILSEKRQPIMRQAHHCTHSRCSQNY